VIPPSMLELLAEHLRCAPGVVLQEAAASGTPPERKR
jgi:hypothetical protein